MKKLLALSILALGFTFYASAQTTANGQVKDTTAKAAVSQSDVPADSDSKAQGTTAGTTDGKEKACCKKGGTQGGACCKAKSGASCSSGSGTSGNAATSTDNKNGSKDKKACEKKGCCKGSTSSGTGS